MFITEVMALTTINVKWIIINVKIICIRYEAYYHNYDIFLNLTAVLCIFLLSHNLRPCGSFAILNHRIE